MWGVKRMRPPLFLPPATHYYLNESKKVMADWRQDCTRDVATRKAAEKATATKNKAQATKLFVGTRKDPRGLWGVM